MLKFKEIVLIIFILTVSFTAHYMNMFKYPYFENDEGTYTSQAWSIITQGKIAPYTYWYDHAPAGWIFLAIWLKLTGGFFTFGTSVATSRVFMLVIHVASTLLLFLITKCLTKSSGAGLIAAVIFSLSPLGIYFQRRVLLDNIMIFWVLAALFTLLKYKKHIFPIVLSSIFFGIAVLTKENAIVFLPGFLYLLYINTHKSQRVFFMTIWTIVSILLISSYFLFSILKSEFLPQGFMGTNGEHVSLLDTLNNQFARGASIPFWNKESDFYVNFKNWVERDPVTIIGGVIASAIAIIYGFFNRKFRIQGLFVGLFWIFLLRGKLVIDFYVTPIIPLLAMNIGSVVGVSVKSAFEDNPKIKIFTTYMLTFLVAATLLMHTQKPYTADETSNQVAALNWIKENIPPDTHMIIDDSIFVDMHDSRFRGDPVFNNADWAWKVEKDPAIYNGKLADDWSNITYVAATHEIFKQMREGEFEFIKKAFNNSHLIKMWNKNSSSYIDPPNYISTNGDWMGLFKIENKDSLTLKKSWEFYKANFIKSYGQVVDPSNKTTTSEGQAYSMLRAYWIDDKITFDNLWKWTTDHLQFRLDDKLLSWLWLDNESGGVLGDAEAASDADIDIALSLILAHQKWGDQKYRDDALALLNSIWEKEIIVIRGRHYIISGPGGKREDGYLVNPSYFSPASFKIFAEFDNSHDWKKLASDSYKFFDDLTKIEGNTSKLPPNWILVDLKTGEVKSPKNYISDVNANWYGFDAFRVMWRVMLDYKWFKSSDAKKYLASVAPFYLSHSDNLYSIYSLDGGSRVNYQSISTWSAPVFALDIENPDISDKIFREKIQNSYNLDGGFWGDKNNYFDQNWAWFTSALKYGYLTR